MLVFASIHQDGYEYPQAISGEDMRDNVIPLASTGEAAMCVLTRWDGKGMCYAV